MLRKIVPILLLLTPLAWGQYSTTYSWGLTDITSNLPTVNAWKALPGSQDCAKGITVNDAGMIACVSSAGKISTYDWQAKTWTSDANMGTVVQFAVGGTQEWSLQPTSYCSGFGGYGVFAWVGYWGEVNPTVCAKYLSVGIQDGSILVVWVDNTLMGSFDGGHTYSQVPSGTGIATAISSATLACSIHMDHTIWCGDPHYQATWELPGTANNIAMDAAGNIYIADTHGNSYQYNSSSNSFTRIYNIAALTSLAGAEYGSMFAVIGGKPYHLNVYAGTVIATTSGAYNHCPGLGSCPPTTQHVGTIKVNFPHGIYGQQSQESVSPVNQMNVSSFDVSGQCDLIFGGLDDPECLPTAGGAIECTATNQLLGGGGGQSQPPAPKPPNEGKSIDIRGWDGSISYSNYHSVPGGFVVNGVCGISVNGCTPGTVASCGMDTPNTWNVIGKCFGPDCSPGLAEEAADNLCAENRISSTAHGLWFVELWAMVNGEKLCSGRGTIFSHLPAPLPCQ